MGRQQSTYPLFANTSKHISVRLNPLAMGLLSRLGIAVSTSITLWALVYWATTG